MSCLLITGVAALVILRFAWAPLLMAFVLCGVESPSVMVGAIAAIVLVSAIALRERMAGRPW